MLLVGAPLAIAWCLAGPAPVALTAARPVPPGFIWGVSSSGYQSEGGAIDSDWGRRNAAEKTQDRYGTAVDFRHRYREDIALAHDLGVNTYRIGIDWARVEPQRGKFDPAELAYYDDVLLALKQAGIAPLITLDHFDYPGWVADRGGWTNPATTRDFIAYADLIARRYHNDTHLWITFNEAFASIAAQKANHSLTWAQTGQVRDHMVSAHRQVYDLIHRLDAKAMVTTNIPWMGDRRGGMLMNRLADNQFFDRVQDKCDLVAIDYYGADFLGGMKAVTSQANWLWNPEPAGLYRAIRILHAQYPSKPILIAETGMATRDGAPRADGVKREDALRDTIYWTQRARAEGIDVIGYMVWSLTDNFEWGSYRPRFGLYTVNVMTDPTLKRVATAAVPAYRQIIRDHGVAPDYRPVLPQ